MGQTKNGDLDALADRMRERAAELREAAERLEGAAAAVETVSQGRTALDGAAADLRKAIAWVESEGRDILKRVT